MRLATGTTKRLPTACFGLAALWFLAGSAEIARAESGALLRFVVHGASDEDRQLEKVVLAALSENLAMVPQDKIDEVLDAEPALLKCEKPECEQRFGTRAGARFVVRGVVHYDRSDYRIELSAQDLEWGRPLETEKATCVLCGWAELQDKLAKTARKLGARASVEPGRPKVVVPAAIAVEKPNRFYGVGKWVFGAAALGLLATGGVMLAEDGGCTISIPASASSATCPVVYDTKIESIAFLSAGAALAAASVAFFVLDHRPPKIAPAVSVGAHGASLALVGNF